MNKSQTINQTIKLLQCETHLTAHSSTLLRVTYSYLSCGDRHKFKRLSEADQALHDAFSTILRKRGLVRAGSYGSVSPPCVQDTLTPDHTTAAGRRWLSLMPNMVPRWVRVYDNEGRSCDRYTAVFTGRAAPAKLSGVPYQWPYLAMSGSPFHPQGFGQHGHSDHQPCDVIGNSWGGVTIGRKNHLGTRIKFEDLPEDCQTFVIGDYLAIWRL